MDICTIEAFNPILSQRIYREGGGGYPDHLKTTFIRDGEGHTALWNAVREQHYDIVCYLVNKGAKVE